MKGVEYDHSWVPELHWLEVSENHTGWVAVLKYASRMGSTWERTLYLEPIMDASGIKLNWLGMPKRKAKQVVDALDLKQQDIISAFDKLRDQYLRGAEVKKSEAEKSRERHEIMGKYTGKLG